MDLTRIARGGTPIQLDKLRVLFFDKKATWLIIQRYGMRFVTALYSASKPGQAVELELKSIDALAFFLWAGLQAEANAAGEELTLEQAEAFLVPFKIENIFNSVIVALTRGIDTPSLATEESPGKADAAAARPVAVARPKGPGHANPGKASTLRTRSASPTRSSGKRPRSSGRPR